LYTNCGKYNESEMFVFIARERKPMIRASYYLVKVKLNCCVVVLHVKDSVE
jgi:hypothetical protein